MASIISDPKGRKRIQFMSDDGSRKTIRLGVATMKQAEAIKLRVEHLATAAPDADTVRWLDGVGDRLHARLAAAGLVKPRESTTLGPWLDRYIESRRGELKPDSLKKLEITRNNLLAHFSANTSLRRITPNEASEWRTKMLAGDADGKGKLAEATVKHHVGNAKGFFNEAVRRGLIPNNPLAHLAGGAVAAKNDRYVTPDEAQAIIDACPDLRWKVLFGLARYAGLRTPSETHLLTWGDVDWHRARLNVRSPKTERHKGHEQRLVPITPKLMKLLEDAFAAAPEGQQRIVTVHGNGHLHNTMHSIIKRAGVAPWPRLWQTLRSSCEKELAMSFPQYAVSKWIGHSITVSGRHYANNVPDELFAKAAGVAPADDQPEQAAQTTAQYPAESDGTDKTEKKNRPENPGDSEQLLTVQVAGGGFEPPTSGL